MLPRTFHRRPLPPSLVSFSSSKGRDIFRSALNSGHAESFFHLSECFTTQNEPAFCGLGTLSMALNAFSIDPLRVWKGSWRWFSDEMLDCCRSLDDIRKNGITISEFSCLARCNGLNADATLADAIDLETFEKAVTDACSRTDVIMIMSYTRKVLGQTGDGHFSPIGAYDPYQRMALVMDVARFKYPPHWVKLEQLYAAMIPHDPSTSKSRGYILLRRKKDAESMQKFPKLLHLTLDKLAWAETLHRVHKALNESDGQHSTLKLWMDCVPIDVLLKNEDVLRKSSPPSTDQDEINLSEDDIKQQHSNVEAMIRALRETDFYRGLFSDNALNVDGEELQHDLRAFFLMAIPHELVVVSESKMMSCLCCITGSCDKDENQKMSACSACEAPENRADVGARLLQVEVDRIREQLKELTRVVLDERLFHIK